MGRSIRGRSTVGMRERLSRSRPVLVLWIGFAAIAGVLTLGGSLRWAAAHPHGGLGWDEASYVNIALRDLDRWRYDDLWAWLQGFGSDDRIRPPAYRILAAPLAIASGGETFWLRFSSILGFAIAVGLLGATVWQLTRWTAEGSSQTATTAVAAAVAIACITPGLLHPMHSFYTEYPLVLGTALVLLGLFWGWGDRTRRWRWAWVVWGAGLGLGLLAKVSFIPLAVGLMATALVMVGRDWVVGPARWEFGAASALGGAIALPWWVHNWQPALGYAQFAANFADHNIGKPWAWGTIARWLAVVLQLGLGLGTAVLVGAIVLALARRALTRPSPVFTPGQPRSTVVLRLGLGIGTTAFLGTLSIVLARRTVEPSPGRSLQWSPQLWAIGVCAGGIVPLCFASLNGLNHNPRLVAPILLPLILAIAIALDRLGWTRRLGASGRAIAPLAIQAIVIFQPLFHLSPLPDWAQLTPVYHPAMAPIWFSKPADVMVVQAQWNWTPLMRLALQRGDEHPDIAYFLWNWQLEPPVIQYPWRRDRHFEPPVTQLLEPRGTRHPIAWSTLLERAARHSIVIALDFRDASQRDRPAARLNHEFIQRFSRQAGYGRPIALHPVANPRPWDPWIIVFFKTRQALVAPEAQRLPVDR